MAMRTNRGRQANKTGRGWGLGVGATFGALAAWLVTDLNKPNSTIRRWIDIGRRKRERSRVEHEVKKAAEEAAAVGEEIISDIQRAGHRPPDDIPV